MFSAFRNRQFVPDSSWPEATSFRRNLAFMKISELNRWIVPQRVPNF